MPPTYSFVIPVFNEVEALPYLRRELEPVLDQLDGSAEVIFVDDGSSDESASVLLDMHREDERYKVLRFSRNFGHQVAVSAGLAEATGNAVVVMDADLQDPPEVVLEMARRWREGSQVAYGQRVDRSSDGWVKRTTAGRFYRVLRRLTSVDIPADVGDFRLVDRAVVDAFNTMGERNRFVRGMVAWSGFRQVAVPYVRPARAAGETHYSMRRMVTLAEDALVGFSKAPLRAILVVGAATAAAGATMAGLAVGGAALGRPLRPGFRRAAGHGLSTGVQLVAIGVVGEYVGRILDEAVDRPLYLVASAHGFDELGTRRIVGRRSGRVDLAAPVVAVHP